MDHRQYIKDKLLKTNDRILEFGPLNGPIATKDRFKNVSYADIRTTEEIKHLYTANEYLESTGVKINIDDIVEIDHVITRSYKETFQGTKFDAIVLSHVIEHIPDIINFFLDVSSILATNGKIIIIYPDSRYCFDHFRNGTSFIDAYDMYKSKKSSNRVLDFIYNVVHENRPEFFWKGDAPSKILPTNEFKKALNSYNDAKENKLPDDMHFWPFSDFQFIKFLYDLDRAGLLKFNIDFFHPTQENTQEFMLTLTPKKNGEINFQTYKRLLRDTSQISKESRFRKNINLLNSKLDSSRLSILEKENQITDLQNQITDLQNQITEIYESKRWIYSSYIASAKNKIVRGLKNEKS